MSEADLALVDPDLRALLPLLPNLGNLSDDTLPGIRAVLAGDPMGVAEAGILCEPVLLPGLDGAPPVSAILYRPAEVAAHRPAILHIHGGGYIAGDALRDHPGVLALAEALDCFILSINYRLAPEHPYPAPLDDCLAALTWLHAQADVLGIDRTRIAVRGVSAGGGLAAGLALRVREHDLPIRLLMLIYPMLDDRTAAPGHVGQHIWTPHTNRYGWSAYLGPVAGDPPPEAAPGRATDLSGMPPSFIAVGAIDLFVAEDMAFAGKLIAAGVATELHVYPGAYHAFNLVPTARVTAAFDADCRAALTRAFEPELEEDTA